jgi:hypothetical protein
MGTEMNEVVLDRVNDLSESDSSLLAFFAGEREDSNKKSTPRVRVFIRVIYKCEKKVLKNTLNSYFRPNLVRHSEKFAALSREMSLL